MSARIIVVAVLVDLLLSAQGSDLCERYKSRCQQRHSIECRERVGGVVSPALQSSVSLTCQYLFEAQSFSWTFVNSTDGHRGKLPNQSNRVLALHKVNKSHEGAYLCLVRQELRETFLFVAAHAYFHSCPEAINGKNCTSTQQLQAVVNTTVLFDTRVAYRNGGSCGKKQEVRYLMLKKEGKSIYFCANFGILTQHKCMNNSRVSVVSQKEDKFDFKLMMSEVGVSDAGNYELELSMADAEGYQALSIYRKFSLLVSKTLTTSAPESATLDPLCAGSNNSKPELMLLLRGEVLRNNTNITRNSVGQNEHALLCIVPDKHCCTNLQGDVKADFLWPNGTVVGDTYVTRSRQVLRLNSVTSKSDNDVESGKYCCTTTSSDLNSDPVCVNVLDI